MQPLRLQRSHQGAVLTLRLPGGALSARVAADLAAAANQAREDRAVRVVVLTAAGPDFCTGAADDLDRLGLDEDPAASLARLRVPVVAAVAGACRSVGFELVLACDVVLATVDASFSLADVFENNSLPCWGGTQRLPRALGAARSSAMILLGEALSAPAAYQAGLVYALVEPQPEAEPGLAAVTALDGAAQTVADKLSQLGPLALEYAKEAVHRGAELPLRDGLRLEGDLNTLLATSADRAEGLAAFFAKRPADFAGR